MGKETASMRSFFHIRVMWVAWGLILTACPVPAGEEGAVGNLDEKIADLRSRLPAVQRHFEGTTKSEIEAGLQQGRNHRQLLREKIQDQWFAALVSTEPGDGNAIKGRFQTWKGLADFIAGQGALAEVWSYAEGGIGVARRIPATELAEMREQQDKPPLLTTLTYREPVGGRIVTERLEFGFGAAQVLLGGQQAYQRQCDLQKAAREVLGARDDSGRLNSTNQLAALGRAIEEGRFPLERLSPPPAGRQDLLVAAEYEVDEFNTLSQPVRLWWESEIQRRVLQVSPGQYAETLWLTNKLTREGCEVRAYRVKDFSDELEPVPAPLPGRDFVELRVRNAAKEDPRSWNTLEFGEPELVRQSALAHLGLINAHLEKRRKEIDLKRNYLDLFAEPVFAGLNIGGGLAGVAFPIGAAARLGYNVLVTPWFIPDVPTVKQMRELFQLLAAWNQNPDLKLKPAHFLGPADLESLEAAARRLTDAEVQDYLQSIQDEDLKALIRIAQMKRLDRKVSNLLSIIADAGRVSGWTERGGAAGAIFNNIYVSVTGEISINYIIASLAGGNVATPKSGVSLESLSQGEGPAAAWLQYLNITVDLRAVLNTIARLSHRSLADKELKKPVPYAPRMSDLAAYEIHVFGYPLLIYYKRGLMKEDYESYVKDYAYGLLGATIVEHFKTREEMDAEIRAGNMVPLGYVRVPTLTGAWKESKLAVFAHRIPGGKHKGKTTLIIYGMRAYKENSQLVQREWERFKAMEQAFEQGGIIEQMVDAEGRDALPAEAFEPVLLVGNDQIRSRFDALLARLLEWRRHLRLAGFGVASDTNREALETIRSQLAAEGIIAVDGTEDPLVDVDRWCSSFLYRKHINGRWRVVKLTSIPSRSDRLQALARAEEAEHIERLRQTAVSPSGEGIALINSNWTEAGRSALGPLRRSQNGEVIGCGVRTGAKAMEELLAVFDQLPVEMRARLQRNQFAATRVEMDVEGDGRLENVFLTLEFPPDGELRRERINPLSGLREVLRFEEGCLRSVVTDQRITVLDYDDYLRESATRTCFNAGTRQQPIQGKLLEETQTTAVWFRRAGEGIPDGREPRLSKIRFNHVTGEIARETYGEFPLPVETVDDQFIKQNSFNPYGIPAAVSVLDNGRTPEECGRPLLAKLLEPIPGGERFILTTLSPPAETSEQRDLRAEGYRLRMERRDVVRHLSKTIVLDAGCFGRIASETWIDPLDGNAAIAEETTRDYREDYFYGFIPWQTIRRSCSNGVQLAAARTVQYDPLARRLTAEEVDHTGLVCTQTWDYRWESPIETATDRRVITNGYNRTETTVVGASFGRTSGEELGRFSGAFDSTSGTWHIQRIGWYMPGVTNRIENETRSGFGRRISTRNGELFETRFSYNPEGIEQTSRILRKNPVTGRFDLPHQVEDDYRWRAGERDAQIQTYIEGRPYDSFRRVSDAEGRPMLDRVKRFGGWDLRSALHYDGDTERITRSEDFQGGFVRTRSEALPAEPQPDGSWRLPVIVTPRWGLVSTQTIVLGDVLGRPVSIIDEHGRRVVVRDWFADSAVPKVSEILDWQGNPVRRDVMVLNAGSHESIPCDRTEQYALSFWGTAAPQEVRTTIRGTDIPLVVESGETRTQFKMDGGLALPWFKVDPHGRRGISLVLDSVRRTNVVAVLQARLDYPPLLNGNGSNAGPVLRLTEVELGGLFYCPVTQRTFDRAGNVLEESAGRTPDPGNAEARAEALFQAPVTWIEKVRRHFEGGWLEEAGNSAAGARMLRYTRERPPGNARSLVVNRAGIAEFPTRMDKVRFNTAEGAAGEAASYVSHRIHSPRMLERNPYQPDEADVWTAWTDTELDARGARLYSAETIFDSQGRLRATHAAKKTRIGEPATKMAYTIVRPAPGEMVAHPVPAGLQAIELDLLGREDFEGADFVYLHITGATNAAVGFRDLANHVVRVRDGPPDSGRPEVSPWPLYSSQVQWLPSAAEPRQGALIQAPAWLLEPQQIMAVAIADLAVAGLDIRHVRGAWLELSNATVANPAVSPLRVLLRGGSFIAGETEGAVSRTIVPHSSGLDTVFFAERKPGASKSDAAEWPAAVIELNGQTVAVARTPGRHPGVPSIIWQDTTDSDGRRPLFALSGRDGHFVERYHTMRLGDVRVSSESQGFAVPQRDWYRAGVLEDEISPWQTTYGEDYAFTVRNQQGATLFSRFWQFGRRRVEANIFRSGAEYGLRLLGEYHPATNLFGELDSLPVREAEALARNIDQLPMPAAGLVSRRELPWRRGAEATGNEWPIDWDPVRFSLTRQHLVFPTGLIATAPETVIEKYVDTVQEAEIILLAARMGEIWVAKDLLEFYWLKSDGGQLALHDCYDAVSGAAMRPEARLSRPRYAWRTAEAQLAVAEAAFMVGLESGEAKWLGFGQGLMEVALREFRPEPSTNAMPRGLSRRLQLPITRAQGFTLWPDAAIYPVRSNVRAYLLLRWLNLPDHARWLDNRWNLEVKQALAEQEGFLKQRVLPRIEPAGVVPDGLFEVQNIASGTIALAAERSTSAQDWLWLLEAAQPLDVAPETARRWLENLARVHGVWVDGVWGLDSQMALLRQDAISIELTARFHRVARLLDHRAAADFAQEQLGKLQEKGSFPVARTRAPANKPLELGIDGAIYPHTNHQSWPNSVTVYQELRDNARRPWKLPASAAAPETRMPRKVRLAKPEDTTSFLYLAVGFHAAILIIALFWWGYRALRRRKNPGAPMETLVPRAVMRRAEERWAKRVLGLKTPVNAENWRFSNTAVEQNFLIQLRAIYKLILEWRRQVNGWREDDPQLAESGADPWLNGADEFASLMGVYMRWVIKAGAKDGFRKANPFDQNEDSNHIWSRLTMYFSEHLWSLLTMEEDLKQTGAGPKHEQLETRMAAVLEAMGMRRREGKFDARELFDFPANPEAMDMFLLQKPGATLRDVMWEAALRLNVPIHHITEMIGCYQRFKDREEVNPIHPYLLEFAKVLPQFALVLLGASVWFNHSIGDSSILSYLGSVVVQFGFSPWSLLWVVPLLSGLALAGTAQLLRAYRFEAPIKKRERATMILEASLSRLFATGYDAAAKTRGGRWWTPQVYQGLGWTLRAAGYLCLAGALLRLDTPSLATFLIVKGLIAMWALAEVAAIAVPLTLSFFSRFAQDWVTSHARAGWFVRFFNGLNITATRPASPLWLSIKYHTQPSLPTGGSLGLIQAVVFYFLLAATFIASGIFICQEVFALWLSDTYHNAEDWKLFLGSLGFWSTMYLLRYGLFLLFTGVASALATFPLKVMVCGVAILQLIFVIVGPDFGIEVSHFRHVSYAVTVVGVGVVLSEHAFRRRRRGQADGPAAPAAPALAESESGETALLGVVYMSGDDLSALKLTPDLLLDRWRVLRDKLDSEGLRLLFGSAGSPEDATLRGWFQDLYEAETRAGVTLWHPLQLSSRARAEVPPSRDELGRGQTPRLAPELGLAIEVDSVGERQRILVAWHLRRWLAGMMSSAGHSQDTGVNLVDIALRLSREGLSSRTVFYLVQNKFDNSELNRPSQLDYEAGELGQRNKLARLLCAVAPGANAHCLQNWTPFGFKAGALTGMDLVYEASLELNTLLLMDRNATVHDLDALMLDLRLALKDPNVVIIIPSRSTTNTRSAIGQGSQMVEEGHRSFLKGLVSILGGSSSEGVGTGWGNILACFYGRVQRALLNPRVKKMPLTSRMQRGSLFADRTEGLIGFGPHAVGISEDLWAVVQTAHNALALGHRIRFAVSRAMWHKVRETWSHAEWLASFPRWAGGYFQMVQDPLMQRINDLGPQSVFAREMRANSGRIFLSAPLALVHVLAMPLAILLDVTPFVQVLLVLWNAGFVLNQVLTLHALNLYLEACGFYRFPAVIGAAVTAGWCVVQPAAEPFAPGLILLGLLVGGFFVGLSRWLATRLRDMILFGPQLILHAIGQVFRLSLEFVISGASPEDAKSVNMAFRAWVGPREDRPLESYPHFINLRTVVWVIGLPYLALSAVALSNLDLLNALMLLPLLLFSVSTVAGPFLFRPGAGNALGLWVVVPRALGWMAGLVFYLALSWCITAGGSLNWVTLALYVVAAACLLRATLRYLPFRGRVERSRRKLVALLGQAGIERESAADLARRILQMCAGSSSKIQGLLEGSGLGGPASKPILDLADGEIVPLLSAPAAEGRREGWFRSRWWSEWQRTTALALLVLFWIFIVPLPARITLSASGYHLTIGLGDLLLVSAAAIGIILLGEWIGRFIQCFDLARGGRRGLKARFDQAFGRLELLLKSPGVLTGSEVAHSFALLTDAQTYLDQRSYAYARRTLGMVEAILEKPHRSVPKQGPN